jgi:hypothetical protein
MKFTSAIVALLTTRTDVQSADYGYACTVTPPR